MTEQQELDEILGRWIKGYINGSASKFYVTNQTKQDILDWHNKQIEEVLDRLSAVSSYTDKQFSENPQLCLGKRDVQLAIEAERNKLNKSDIDVKLERIESDE